MFIEMVVRHNDHRLQIDIVQGRCGHALAELGFEVDATRRLAQLCRNPFSKRLRSPKDVLRPLLDEPNQVTNHLNAFEIDDVGNRQGD